jgi:hypothetical protein
MARLPDCQSEHCMVFGTLYAKFEKGIKQATKVVSKDELLDQ